MPADDGSPRPSLCDLLGNDHLIWQMWRRRSSTTPSEELMLQLHTMFASDPDMRLLSSQKTLHNVNTDDCLHMLDSASSSLSLNSAATSPSTAQDTCPYVPQAVTQRSLQQIPSKVSTESSPLNKSARLDSKQKISRSQNFLKRLSVGRSSAEDSVEPTVFFGGHEQRFMKIKPGKKLENGYGPF